MVIRPSRMIPSPGGKRLLEQHRTKHFPVMDEQSFLVGVRSDRDVATDFGL